MPQDSKTEKSLADELSKTPEDVKAEGKAEIPGDGSSSVPATNQGEDSKEVTEATSPQPTVSDKMYKLPDGREVPADQVVEEYNKLNSEFTRKSQELSEIKKNQNGSVTKEEAQKLDPRDEATRAELRRLGVPLKEDISLLFDEKAKEIIPQAASSAVMQVSLKEALQDLEADFNGENGTPKVEASKVLDFYRDNPQTSLTPLQIAQVIYHQDFVKYEAGKLVEAAKGEGTKTSTELPKTETSGAGLVTEPPTPKYKFGDQSAEKGVREILANGKG